MDESRELKYVLCWSGGMQRPFAEVFVGRSLAVAVRNGRREVYSLQVCSVNTLILERIGCSCIVVKRGGGSKVMVQPSGGGVS